MAFVKKAEVAFQCDHTHKPGPDFPKLHLLNGIPLPKHRPIFPPKGHTNLVLQ